MRIWIEIPLPSSRELAKHLGIARNTVVLAYQQLIDEGYLVSRERSGNYIDKTMLDGRALSLSRSLSSSLSLFLFFSLPLSLILALPMVPSTLLIMFLRFNVINDLVPHPYMTSVGR